MPKKFKKFPGITLNNVPQDIHHLIIDEQAAIKKAGNHKMYGKDSVIYKMLRELLKLRKEKEEINQN